jgi:manganese/iron transport system substrate-binding protein
MSFRNLLAGVCLGMVLSACALAGTNQSPSEPASGRPLRLVASTTIVGDVVRNIVGPQADLQILIPPGVDEHNFQYTPEDVARVADADLVFINGAGLETFAKPLMENASGQARLVAVSDGIALLQAGENTSGSDHAGQAGDPHVWTDPNNVITWAKNISEALAGRDSAHAAEYRANAASYSEKLVELDRWIQQQAAQIPPENRKIVTDHQLFTYFADRYGFQQVGAVVPSYSTSAEPSAKELAALEDAIRQYGVKAVFVGNTVNPSLAQRVAADTNVKLVPIYTGSLSDGPPANTYLDYMRYNVTTIVEALR